MEKFRLLRAYSIAAFVCMSLSVCPYQSVSVLVEVERSAVIGIHEATVCYMIGNDRLGVELISRLLARAFRFVRPPIAAYFGIFRHRM